MERLLNNSFICLFIYSCLIISCKENKTLDDSLSTRNKLTSSTANQSIGVKNMNRESQFQKKEVFYIDSVLVNGRVPLYTTYDFFTKNLGKQDSIQPFTGEIYSAFEDATEVETKSLYKNNSEYELYKGQLIYYNIELDYLVNLV